MDNINKIVEEMDLIASLNKKNSTLEESVGILEGTIKTLQNTISLQDEQIDLLNQIIKFKDKDLASFDDINNQSTGYKDLEDCNKINNVLLETIGGLEQINNYQEKLLNKPNWFEKIISKFKISK